MKLGVITTSLPNQICEISMKIPKNNSLFNSFFNSLLTLEAALAAAGDRAESAAEMLFVKHVPFLSLLRLLRLVVRGGTGSRTRL